MGVPAWRSCARRSRGQFRARGAQAAQTPNVSDPANLGQDGIGLGRVRRRQVLCSRLDDPRVHGLTVPRAARRRCTAAGRRRSGVVSLRSGGGVGQVEFAGQFVRRTRTWRAAGIARGELGGRGHYVQSATGFHRRPETMTPTSWSSDRPGEPPSPDNGVDDVYSSGSGGMSASGPTGRTGRHPGTRPARQEQALLRRLSVWLGGRLAAVRLLAVVAGIGERVRAHAPRSVRTKRSESPRTP